MGWVGSSFFATCVGWVGLLRFASMHLVFKKNETAISDIVMAMGWLGFENLWWVGLGSPSDGLGFKKWTHVNLWFGLVRR